MKREWLIAATIMIVGLLDAGRLAWVCDDAFISYRYASHLADGIGLVYNAGEYVEGYTNFLWTIILSLGAFLGFPLPELSIYLGLGCYGLAVLGFAWLPNESGPDWFALLGAVLISHFRIFATSGLETMLMVACLVWTLRAFQAGKIGLGMGLAGLSVLIRPEGLAVIFLAGLIWIKHQTARFYFIIFMLLVGCYAAWKLWYFGDLLPNTYYAKVGEPRWSTGMLYLWGSFGSQAGSLLIFLAPLMLAHKMNRSQLLATGLLLVYTLHVAKVGGDFMLGRFALPIVACGLVLVAPLFAMVNKQRWQAIGVWTILLLLPLGVDDGHLQTHGITQERDWYPMHWVDEAERQGRVLQPYLKDSDIKIVIYGGQAMMAYYSQAPWVLEGMAGLTDPELAQSPSREKRVGHGAKVTTDLLQSRGVHLYIDFRIQQPAHPLNWIDFGSGIHGSIMSYNSRLMTDLKQKGAHFVDFPTYLDAYMIKAETGLISREQVNRDWPQFQSYYFSHNEDDTRQSRLNKLR